MVNAILAGILSFIIPGLGQAVIGSYKKGIIFFIIALIIGIVTVFIVQHWAFYIVDLLFAIYVAYDAYKIAHEEG